MAFELAEEPTDENVGELVRMASGRRRRWLTSYSVEDMCAGLEAL